MTFPENACNLFSGTLSELNSNLVAHLSLENDLILSTQDTVGMLSMWVIKRMAVGCPLSH